MWVIVNDFSASMLLHVSGSVSVTSGISMLVTFLCLIRLLIEFWVYEPKAFAREVLPEDLRRGADECCFPVLMPPVHSSPSSPPFPFSFWRVAPKMA